MSVARWKDHCTFYSDIVSDAGSMISRRSSLMKLSNARRMTAASTGLWSLASEEPSTSRGLLDVSQTESNMTKSFNSKRRWKISKIAYYVSLQL